ncbi:MAG: succinate dehydrogenase assembly factor 2 [Boseongicola sp.]|nr:succinate dehydrogenase assembly factor 2 [Boseongicola sp.]MDD9977678.1 succinate dehydrogenase assembly factor 2 [Boseongicola sp.]
MTEAPDIRLKRLRMRSWRRGTKEMDLVLGPFFDAEGASMDEATLELYEDLLNENDQDLYQWVSGQAPTPTQFEDLITYISKSVKS